MAGRRVYCLSVAYHHAVLRGLASDGRMVRKDVLEGWQRPIVVFAGRTSAFEREGHEDRSMGTDPYLSWITKNEGLQGRMAPATHLTRSANGEADM